MDPWTSFSSGERNRISLSLPWCGRSLWKPVSNWATADRAASLPLQLRAPPPSAEVRNRDADAGNAGRIGDTTTFLPRRFLFFHCSVIITISSSSPRQSPLVYKNSAEHSDRGCYHCSELILSRTESENSHALENPPRRRAQASSIKSSPGKSTS